nr:MAG TPA: hypothetical protein [Caudoviricetes sp.]
MSAIGVLLSKFVFLHSTGKFFSQREDHRAGATSGHFSPAEYLFQIFIFSIRYYHRYSIRKRVDLN